MSNIPNGRYNVTLGKSANSWASGPLLDPNPGTQNITYKGVIVTTSNMTSTNVSWTVSLNPPGGGSCVLTFTGGAQQSNGDLTGGKVTGPCLSSGVAGDPEDTWTADVVPAEEDAEQPRKAGSY